MGALLEFFLAWFWFLLAASVPVNLLIYRPVFESLAHDKSVARDAYGAYKTMMVRNGGVALVLGALQAAAGFPVPVFPFVSPPSGSTAAVASWIVFLGGALVGWAYLNTRKPAIRHLIARAVFGGRVAAPAALWLMNCCAALVLGLLVLAGTR